MTSTVMFPHLAHTSPVCNKRSWYQGVVRTVANFWVNLLPDTSTDSVWQYLRDSEWSARGAKVSPTDPPSASVIGRDRRAGPEAKSPTSSTWVRNVYDEQSVSGAVVSR